MTSLDLAALAYLAEQAIAALDREDEATPEQAWDTNQDSRQALQDFEDAATPDAVLALIGRVQQAEENIARAQAWISGASCGGGIVGEALLVTRWILTGMNVELAIAKAADEVTLLPLRPTDDDIAWAKAHLPTRDGDPIAVSGERVAQSARESERSND